MHTEDNERNDLKRSGHKLSDSEQSNPWKCKNVYDSHIEEDELEIFGSFDSDVDVDVYGSFPEYSAPSSPYNEDASRRFDVETTTRTMSWTHQHPLRPTLTSQGIPIWEDDWFKWRSRDECDSDSDEDEVDNKKISKGSDFGGGPEGRSPLEMQYGVGALEHPSDFLACLPVDFAADNYAFHPFYRSHICNDGLPFNLVLVSSNLTVNG